MNILNYINFTSLETNDEYLYKRASNKSVKLSKEDTLKLAINNFAQQAKGYDVQIHEVEVLDLLHESETVMKLIQNTDDCYCFTDDAKLQDTLEAMAKHEDMPHENLIISSAQALFNPTKYSLQGYYAQIGRCDKSYLSQQIASIIPENFSYIELYKIEYLINLHKQFISAIVENFDAQWFKQINPDEEVNTYQYIDIIRKYFTNMHYFPNLLKSIYEIFFISNIRKLIISVDKINEFKPYLYARGIREIFLVTKKPGIQATNLMKCKITYPNPPIELRRKTFSISDLTKLLNNPIAFYLESILAVKQLKPNQSHLIGIAIHYILERCIQSAVSSIEEFRESINVCIEKYNLSKIDKSIMIDKIYEITEHLWPIIQESEAIYCEVEGVQDIMKHGETYKLHGRADLIYKTKEGEYGVIDFKTGSIPSWSKIAKGRSPQGPLEILLLASGAFIKEQDIKLAECGLLSPKGFCKIDNSQSSIGISIQGVNDLLEIYWMSQSPYPSYIVEQNKFPTFCREWNTVDHFQGSK